jgi:hypothetical protein
MDSAGLDKVTVPPGHGVRLYDVAADPFVIRTGSGVIVAHLGFGGDEPDEVDEVFEKVSALLGDRAPSVRFVSQPVAINDLFAPAPVELEELHDVVVWTARSDTFVSQMAVTSMERLLERFRRCGSRSQWLVSVDTLEDRELVEGLARLGIGLVTCAAQPFLAEVDRPDGISVVGFVATAHGEQPRSIPGTAGLIRAPRLRRLLLAVAEEPSADSWRSLLDELLRREHPLLFVVEEGRPSMMKWPGLDAALPVFADLRSLMRAAAELQRQPGTYGIGVLAGRKLYSYAHENRLPLAMNVYPDEGPARYVVLTLDILEDLASGRLSDE